MPPQTVKTINGIPGGQGQPGFIWIPRLHTPHFKVTIAGVDVTGDLLSASCTRPAEHEIGTCKIKLWNPHGTYSNTYTGGEEVLIYIDLTDATTVQFNGFIEKYMRTYQDGIEAYEINGLHYAGKLLDVTVTRSYTNATLTSILNDLSGSYASWLTLTNVNSTLGGTAVSVTWNNKPFWECIVDLCNILGANAYVDNSLDLHFFLEDSITSTMDAVVFDDNLQEVHGLGEDKIMHKNRVIIYGKDNFVWMKEDTTAQAGYYLKETVIRDSNVSTVAEADILATAKLQELAVTDMEGVVTSLLLPYVNPAECIYVSIPTQNILGLYRMHNITHTISSSYHVTTELEVYREGMTMPKYFRDQLGKSIVSGNIDNINEMKYSLYFPFDDNSNVFSSSNLTIFEGKLTLTGSATTGTLISSAQTQTVDMTSFEARAFGENLSATKFYASTDNGITWTQIYNYVKTALPAGKMIKVKIEVSVDANGSLPSIDTFMVLYK